jgi:parvulin-like peptidyl-prolyl isomerase
VLAEATTSQPSEQQLQQFFDQNPARYATDGILTVRHLVIPLSGVSATDQRMAKAHEVVTALRADAPVEAVVARYGLAEPRNDGDEFYFAAKIHLGDSLFEAALKFKEGTVSEPLPAADGIHIFKVIKNKVPVPLTFDRARLQVMTDLKDAQQTRLMEATMKFLRDRSKILIATDYRDYKP